MKFLVRLAGATVALFLLATTATAAISSISPSSGTVEPKQSVSASFTVVDSLTSCFSASAPRGFVVTFNGLEINCALEGAEVTMTVEAGAKVSPGNYAVTINETSIDGQLLDTHTWPVTVPGSPTTTTTIAETTTTKPPTTTSTQSPTTSSTQSATTTSTQAATATSVGSVTSTTSGATNTTSGDAVASGNPTGPPSTNDDPATSTSGEGGNSPGAETGAASTDQSSDERTEDEGDSEVLAGGSTGDDDDLPYDRYPANRGDVAPEVLSRTVFSDQLRSQLSRALPLAVTDAVLTPVVIAEFVYQSLLHSATSLLVPILLAAFVGLLMVWRMREEIDDDELALSRQSMG